MLYGKILKILFRGKNWLFCSLLSACIVCPLSGQMPCLKRVPHVERPFPFSTLWRAIFQQNRQKLVINSPHPTSPQINDMFWLSCALSLFSGGWGLAVPFYSFQGCNHDGWFRPPIRPPPPPKKKSRMGKWRILASLQASAIFIFISLWGLGVFHLLQDRRPDPEIAAKCEQYQKCLFLSFKGTRD